MVLNDPLIDGLIGTTRAVDIISGGVKAYVEMCPEVDVTEVSEQECPP